MPVSIELEPGDDRQITALARNLKQLGDGKEVAKEFRKALQKSTQPALVKAKQAALNLPSQDKTKGAEGLRRRIVRAMSIQVKLTGDPRVAVRISKPSLGTQRNLPRLMNTGTWRHPVYGNTKVWVPETSRANWFDDVMKDSAPDVKRELESTIDIFEKRLRV
jgi:hypothetical protein